LLIERSYVLSNSALKKQAGSSLFFL